MTKKPRRLTALAKAQRQLDKLIARGARPRTINRATARRARRALASALREAW